MEISISDFSSSDVEVISSCLFVDLFESSRNFIPLNGFLVVLMKLMGFGKVLAIKLLCRFFIGYIPDTSWHEWLVALKWASLVALVDVAGST